MICVELCFISSFFIVFNAAEANFHFSVEIKPPVLMGEKMKKIHTVGYLMIIVCFQREHTKNWAPDFIFCSPSFWATEFPSEWNNEFCDTQHSRN